MIVSEVGRTISGSSSSLPPPCVTTANSGANPSTCCASFCRKLCGLVAQHLPNRKPVGTKHDASAHRRIVGQLGAQADVVVPRGEVLAAWRHLLVVLFCLFFCHSCCVTIAIIVNWYSLRIKSAGINLVRSAPEVKG